MRVLSSVLLERQAFAGLAGMQFKGARDLYTVLGYDETISIAQYRAKARRGIAKRIVHAYPKETWRGGAALVEDEDPENTTPFEKAWDDLNARIPVWSILKRADILARLGRYSVVLIGAGGKLEEELPKAGAAASKLLYLKPYAEDEASIVDADLESDKTKERYGKPKFYTLKLRAATGTSGVKVHHSRMLHVAEDTLDDDLYSEPCLESVWNYLMDLEKVHGAGSEAYWRHVNPKFQAAMDATGLTPPIDGEDGEALLSDQIEEMTHNLRDWIGTEGVDLKQFTTTVAPIGSNVSSLLELIAATSEIPQRILMGSERGQLASEQDSDNWDERVSDRRTGWAAPSVVRPLVDRLIAYNYLPKPVEYRVEWPQIDNLNDAQRSEIAAAMADVNQKSGTTVYVEDEIRAITGHPSLVEVRGEGELDEDETEIEDDEDESDLRDAGLRALAAQPWEAVQAAARRGEKAVGAAVERGFKASAKALDTAALERAFAANDHAEAQRIATAALAAGDDAMREKLSDALLAVLAAGGRAAAKAARAEGRFLRTADRTPGDDPLDIAFDVENPRARRWALTRAADLVVEIGKETVEAIRGLIGAAFEDGLAPREAARFIRDSVGLNSTQERAVRALARELREAEPGSLITRAGGKFKARLPKAGDLKAFIKAKVAKYRERMHKLRAVTIARTETIAASNQGQVELWRQAVDQGLLEPDVRQLWVTTPDERLCPICEALDGETAALGETFPGGVSAPPAHANCRCALAVAEPKRQQKAAQKADETEADA